MTDQTKAPAMKSDLSDAIRVLASATMGVGLYQSLAIVGALVEARVLDPMAVAKWADFFAANPPANTPADAREGMREGIAGFAAAIRSMSTPPPGAGQA